MSYLLGGVCALALVGPAFAQAQPAAAPAATEVEEVMVTGSRIVRDGYEAPTPTSVISSQEIEARAPASIADYINQLPQLQGSNTPRTTLNSSTTTGGGANTLNMRGLGATRTLTLLDGRRVVSAGLNSAVDINLLPTNLVSRVDVVTGGASAAYGSDAVAGVTNFVLDSGFTGIKGNIQSGVTDRKDGENWNADLAFGTKFADGRGHILLSAQGLYQKGIDDINTRDWYRPGYNFIANPAYTAGSNLPARILRTDVGFTNATEGGLILSGPLRGLSFGPEGQRQQFVFGDILSGTSQAGGTLNDPAKIWGLLPDLKNWSYFGRATYDVTDKIHVYGEFAGGGSDSDNWSAPTTMFGTITINRDNAFLPADVAATAFSAANPNSFTYGRLNYDLHTPNGHQTEIGYHRRQTRYLVGAQGEFLDSGKWNAYYQRGDSTIWYTYSNMLMIGNPAANRFNMAVDSVLNPATGGVVGVAPGTPVCRSTLTNPTNGCVPVNIFGVGVPSQAAIRWMTGVTDGLAPARQDIDLTQEVWAADAQYEPFNTWAGPVSVALGGEYRKESYTATVDAASTQRLWFAGGFTPSQGEFTVKEFFGETIVPLARDLPFIKSLDFNGAVRRTDYSTSGKVTTWKAGGTWDVYDDLRIRGTLSRDIRAPNMLELFNGGVASVGQVADRTQAGSPSVSYRQITGGNPLLKPENAKTRTFGAVYSPSYFRGFSASIDYYKIDVKDAIVTVSTQQIVDQCFGVGVPLNPAACGSIVRANPNNLIDATINTGGVNAQKQAVEGVDYEVSYRTPIDLLNGRLNGNLDLRALGSQRLQSYTILAGAKTDALGTPGDGPKWRWIVTASYAQGPSRTTLTYRFFGKGVINNWPLGNAQSVNVNHYGATNYFDLAQNYDIFVDGKKVTLYGVVENLLDRNPPRIPGQTYGASSTYDLIGRSYRVGARFKF
jgi:iron complex outermembrane receptor protein